MDEGDIKAFLDYVESLEKVEGGQTANLKISNEDFRVWEDRVDGSISVECLVSGNWITIARWS